jgi:hypothetical protein
MKRFKPLLPISLLLCLSSSLVLAQNDCPSIVESALAAVESFCEGVGRNQACYGNVSLEAQPQPDVRSFKFEQVGDIVDVSDVQSMKLSPMDEVRGVWGVALMRLQANLPDTLPGQNVTFLLFGDVTLENRVPPDNPEHYTPMQTFYLRTGIGDAACEEAPESGLLVQTPAGVGEVAFNVNGVDVQMGSTVFFQASDSSGQMTVSTLEGAAFLQRNQERHVIIAGTRGRLSLYPILDASSGGGAIAPIPTTGGTETLPPPTLGESYDDTTLKALPLNILERKIDIHAPLSEEQRAQAIELLNEGEPICGEEGFPPCHELPFEAGGVACIFLSPGETLPEGETRPLCPTPEPTPQVTETSDN